MKIFAYPRFKVGQKVKIVSNDLQPEFVGSSAIIKKIYPVFSEGACDCHVYRVKCGNDILKGVALESDLIAENESTVQL